MNANQIKAPELSRILEDGSLFVPARVFPAPDTISEAAQRLISRNRSFASLGGGGEAPKEAPSYEKLVTIFGDMHKTLSAQSSEIFPVEIQEEIISGVRTHVLVPKQGIAPRYTDCVLINTVGGGVFTGPNNKVEAIPLASLLGIKVLKPVYRNSPQNSFRDGVDDIIAVYKNCLEHHPSSNIGLYGSCVGGTLAFQTVSQLLYMGLPVPGAIVGWGASGEPARVTDSDRTNHDLDNATRNLPFRKKNLSAVDGVDTKNPLFSPIYANLKKFPPSLLTAGTRDFALSATSLMHRALLKAGVRSELVIFEAMEHGFLYYPDLPEAQELYRLSADFFARHLGRSGAL